MVKAYDFDKQNEDSKPAVTLVEDYLRNRSDVVEVMNVEDDPFWQGMDVDILLGINDEGGNTKILRIDVKADFLAHQSHNFFLETVSNVEKQTPGCFLTSEADYWFYYIVHTGELYAIPLKEFREWYNGIGKYSKSLKKQRTSTKRKDGEYLYASEGYTISISEACQQFGKITKIW